MRCWFKVSALTMIIIIGIGFAVPADAAAKKKTVYVVTQVTVTSTDSGTSVYSFKYKKNGLLNKSKASINGGRQKETYSYKYKGNRITKQTRKAKGMGASNGFVKYSYNKCGQVIGAKVYVKTGRKSRLIKTMTYKWYSPGAWSDARLQRGWYERKEYETGILKTEISKYTDIDGSVGYDVCDSAGSIHECHFPTYDSKGNVIGIVCGVSSGYEYHNGVYEPYYKPYKRIQFKYKRIKTKRYSAANTQQESLLEFIVR